MNFVPLIILLVTILSVATITKTDDDPNELIDINLPEIVTLLEDDMIDPDTSDYSYYINKGFLGVNMNEARFNRSLEAKNVNVIEILRLVNSDVPVNSYFLSKYYEKMTVVHLENTVVRHLKLHDFPNLQRVMLENCGIDILHYEMIPFTNKLKDVGITHNRIQHISDVTFSRSPGLIRLNLSHNNLREIDNKAFGMLTELRGLKLDYNYLKKLHVNLLQNCTKLQYLSLSHNMLFTLEFYFFDNLRDLLYLDVSHNPLFNFDYGTIFGTRFPLLRWYKIDGLPCSTLEFKLFKQLRRRYYLLVSERKAHIIQRLDPAQCQKKNVTRCLYRADLLSDVRERLWWENKVNNILCVDYFGNQWRQSLRPYSRPNITELANDLLQYTEYLTEREVYAVEMLSMTRFLRNFVADIARMHRAIGDVKYYNVGGYDRCY